jgi:hypothetical protein
MATVRLKNKLNAPLALELGAGNGLHLQALEEREVDEKVLKSEQVQAAIKAGHLKVILLASSVNKTKKGSEQ